MSQFLRLSIVMCCAFSGLLAARTATAQPPDNPAPAADVSPPANFSVESEAVAAVCEKIEQALNATAEVDFNESPLSEVVSSLRETYQIPIIIDNRALDDVGMGSDTPVTMSLHGISLRSLLKLMLKGLELTYVVHDQVLKITSPEEAEKELTDRVYPVADLAVAGRQSLVVNEPESNYTTVQRLMSDNIAPDSWNEVGGASNSESFDPWGILVVSQTRENHEALASLLAAVRKARSSAEGATGTPADWQPIPVTSDVKLAAHAKIERALSTTVNVEFAAIPLNEVAKYLRDTYGVPIWIDRRALDDVGMGGETPVTFSLQSVSLRSALRLMLRELDLVYQVDDEVLKITTPEESENELTMQVYLVRDFLESPPNAGGRLERSQSLVSLQELIESIVAPDTWDHVGGAGVLSPVEPWGLLVISQTAEVHEQVNNLLQTARRARHASLAPASAPSLTTPTVPVPGVALGVPPTPPTVLPSATDSDPFRPLTPVLTIPGPILASTPLGFVSASGEAMILKVYTVSDFDTEQLMTAIRSVVAPETWGKGENSASMFPLGARILIRQAPAAHAEIQELIDGLRPHQRRSSGD